MKLCVCLGLSALTLAATAPAASPVPLYRHADAPIADRVADLLGA